MTRSLHTRRARIVAFATGLLLTLMLGVGSAAPSFGPGNADGHPHDAQSKCHPPGQTVDTPGCQ